MAADQASMAAVPPASPKKKRHILTVISLSVLVLIVGLVSYIAVLPDDFRYQRSAVINAPAAAVFPLINDFHQWPQWSPWEKIDPNLQRTYDGPKTGVGATYSWVGNAEVGAGKMTILESKPEEQVSIHLEFFKPFAGVCPTTFKLEPSGSGTKVTWTMEGKNHFIPKAMSLFIDMDQMIGKNFEDGLAKMDQVAQELAKKPIVPELTGKQKKALIDQTKLTIKNLDSYLQLYGLDHEGEFPKTSEGLEILVQKPQADAKWQGPYTKDPLADAWGKPFKYEYPGEHLLKANRPEISSSGPDQVFGTPDDITNW